MQVYLLHCANVNGCIVIEGNGILIEFSPVLELKWLRWTGKIAAIWLARIRTAGRQ
jgi:hypothetical protein